MCGDASVRTFWKVRKPSIEHTSATFGTHILIDHSDQKGDSCLVGQVPFEEVLEPLGQRQVMMHRGQAFVPSSQLSVMVVGRFRTMLSRCLVQMHKVVITTKLNTFGGLSLAPSGDASS